MLRDATGIEREAEAVFVIGVPRASRVAPRTARADSGVRILSPIGCGIATFRLHR
jgi:hypothetical protein